jgi:hypothetical protein
MKTSHIAAVMLIILFSTGNSLAQFNPKEDISNRLKIHQELKPESGNEDLERIGAWPYGPSFSVAVDSVRDIVFLGSGGAVLILDGTDKMNPQLITDTIRTVGLVEDIFYDVSKERLYLACGEGGYEIWNVENTSVPFLYSRNEIYYGGVETPVGHVQVRGDFAVFECGFGYIHSVNVSDPYNPFQVSINGLVGNPAHNIHIDQSGYVHATGYDNYVILYMDGSGYLYDYGSLPIQNCNAVFGGTQAYYVGQGVYLWIIYAGGYSKTDVGGVTHIEVRGNLAYILNNDGLFIWDVTNNEYPYLIGSAMDGYGQDLYVAGKYAYIALGSEGLNIFDITNPSSPVLVGSYDGYSSSRAAVVKNNIAYVSRLADGLSMIDISNPEYPELIGQFETSGYNYDVKVKDSLAFLACWEAGFKIVDVSDPTSPTLVSSIDNFNASKLELSEDYAYIDETYPPNTSFNIRIIDITNPDNPVEVSSTSFPSYVNELAYYNGYLFIATNAEGLRILNVTDPQNPVEVNHLILPTVRDVYIRNNLMYVCPGSYGVRVYDITNPEIPVEVSNYEFGYFFDVAVVDSFWYASDAHDIWLLYLEDSNPIYLDQYRLPYSIFDLEALDKYVYIADGAAGFSIYKNNLIENPPISNWEFQTSGISEDIWAVDFTSLTEGWAAADHGILLHTTDGGNNWQINQVGDNSDDFRGITFVNETTGWVCGENSSMYKTTNGGQNWFALSVPTTSVVRAMCFLDESLGWVVTLEDHLILKTTDGGGTWTQQNSGLVGNLHHFGVCFTDENNGYVIGFVLGSQFQNYILKTTNGGESWTPNFDFQNNDFTTIYFANQNTGWIGGYEGFLAKTTDAGNTWQVQNSRTSEYITDFFYTDENKGWYTGFNGTLFQTNDGGNSWLQHEVLIQDDLRGIYFVDETNGWAVGSNGIILHYHETVTNNDNEDIQAPVNFELSQNYPNPFNPTTTIQYSIPERGNVSIKVFNTLGEEVTNLVNEYQQSGIYKVNFNAGNLSSGIYFYRLNVNDYSSVKKMILLK